MMLRRLELDYIAAPRRAHWPGAIALAIALGVAALTIDRYRDLQHQLAALEEAQGLINADSRPMRSPPKEKLDEETKQVDAVVRQLTLPWAQMIESIEAASISDVAVLQMQPEAQQRLLRLTAEAKNREAMLEYVRRLGEAKMLSEVHLVSHQVQLEDPSHPIQFSVQASFRGSQ